jgi:predicted metalloendopeptidase
MPASRPRVNAATPALAISNGAFAHTNERGIDAQNFDESVGACTDFFEHAFGGWLKSNPIPAEHSRGAATTNCASTASTGRSAIFPNFAGAFACGASQPMLQAPGQRVVIW